MQELDVSRWPRWLAEAPLDDRQRQGVAITVRWYLSFCRRGRAGVTHQSARDFIEWAQKEKRPEPWQLERWKEAIRWLFRTAKAATGNAEPLKKDSPTQKAALASKSGTSLPVAKAEASKFSEPAAAVAAWKKPFLTVLRQRHYSYRTEQSYLVWLERFERFCGVDDLEGRGPEDIKAFLDKLALDERLSASSQRQALNAVVFLLREVFGKELGDFSDYRRAKVRPHAPTWLTKTEIQLLLDQLAASWRLIASVAFGGGLRLMELLRLRVKDVDLEQGIITVHGGKGDKDRFVPLAETIIEPLRRHLEEVRKLYEKDRREEVSGVWLPEGLERKYPKAGEEWPWFWVWPDDRLSFDPRSGLQRRHHVSDRLFQLRIKAAARQARLNKRVTPHVLRHTFASQLLDGGCDIRTVQELLGHKSVETTMIYTHPMRKKGLGVKSPLDNL